MPETNTSSTNTFCTSRILPFSPAAIYGAFASAEQLAAWWGPEGFTNHFELFEFTAGGRWHFVMQGPDGQKYPNRSVFAELEPNRKIVIRHDCAPFFTLTVEVTPLEDKTELSWLQVFDNADVAQAVRHIVEPANEQNLDRLTQILARRWPKAQAIAPAAIAAGLTEYWSPRVIGEVDDAYIKVAKVLGTLAWHSHADEDEMFLVLKGQLKIEMEHDSVVLNAGEMFIVPKGVRHNPVATEECQLLLIERKSTRHTGEVDTEKTRSLAEQLRPV